jgi:hypothetical protein
MRVGRGCLELHDRMMAELSAGPSLTSYGDSSAKAEEREAPRSLRQRYHLELPVITIVDRER